MMCTVHDKYNKFLIFAVYLKSATQLILIHFNEIKQLSYITKNIFVIFVISVKGDLINPTLLFFYSCDFQPGL